MLFRSAVGEVGLTGELRDVARTELRLAEVARLGFKRCVLPADSKAEVPKGLKAIYVKTIGEAFRLLL